MSYVESLVKSKLAPRASSDTPSGNRITTRLDDRAHWKLVTMSAKFGMSKSATAEDLLESAIADAFKIFFTSLNDNEKAEIVGDVAGYDEYRAICGAEDDASELGVDANELQRLYELRLSKLRAEGKLHTIDLDGLADLVPTRKI